MRDYRNEYIDGVSKDLMDVLDDDQLSLVIPIILQRLGSYELSERSTEIVKVDDRNSKLIKMFASSMLVDGRSESTIKTYVNELKKLCKYFNEKDLKSYCTFDIKMYLGALKMKGNCNRTIENKRSYICSFFSWLAGTEQIDKNPCATIKPIKYDDEIRLPFTTIEIDKLKGACNNPRERAMLELLMSSGVRVNEFINIRLEDIDFIKRTVRVRKGKGGKERYTYMDEVACNRIIEYLTQYGIESGFVFVSAKRKTQLTTSGVRSILKQIGNRARIEDVHPHRFRRTLATTLAKRGMEIQKIQQLLGHTSINTTMIYINMDNTQVMGSYAKCTA